jgi:uncharacterized protein (TIRG00374 family)
MAISAAFLALVIGRVDLAQVAAALGAASPGVLLLALGVMAIDLLVRASRWRALLAGFVPEPPGVLRAASYLTIGFFANSLLPARLGDVARAYLAATAFRGPRLATFGTVLVERVADGLTMVALVLISSLIVVSLAELRELQAQALLLGVLGATGFAVAWLALWRGPLARTRVGTALREFLARMAAGAAILRRPRGIAVVLGTTLLAATTASLVSGLVAAAVGLALSPAQVVLFTSGIALSLAIPAAPSSLGTFEFVGVLILTSFGATAEVGLATVLLVRLVTTVPLALVGLVVTWATHLRPAALFSTAAAEAELAGDPVR